MVCSATCIIGVQLTSCSLGQLIKILRQHQMENVVDKLIDFSGGKDEELRDISGLGKIVY